MVYGAAGSGNTLEAQVNGINPRSTVSPRRVKMAGRPLAVETERFKLRSLRGSDASAQYAAWFADPDLMTPLNMPVRTLSIADLKAHIAGFDNHLRYVLGMFDKASGEHFGVFLIDTIPLHRIAKLQYLIGVPEYRGIGALRETGAGLITSLFKARGIEKVAAQVTVGNEPSMAALKALGFRAEGEMKGEIRSFQDGRRLDQLFFGLLKDEWQARTG